STVSGRRLTVCGCVRIVKCERPQHGMLMLFAARRFDLVTGQAYAVLVSFALGVDDPAAELAESCLDVRQTRDFVPFPQKALSARPEELLQQQRLPACDRAPTDMALRFARAIGARARIILSAGPGRRKFEAGLAFAPRKRKSSARRGVDEQRPAC